jgi:DNA replication and repair protein RecF
MPAKSDVPAPACVKILLTLLLHSIKSVNFRNLKSGSLEFSDRANFISGRNGHGKTNLLESIYWLLSLRPKRGTVQDCVKKGESAFRIESDLTFGELKHHVNLDVEGKSKKLQIDGTQPRRKRDYLEQVLVVDFFPEDLLILVMEPALRRRFIDIASAQYSLPHEEVLRRFKRTLEQRNRLLKTPGGPDRGVLESFDRPLSESAALVTSMRLHLLSKLGKLTDELFREGIGEKYVADIRYISTLDGIPDSWADQNLPDPAQFQDIYYKALGRNRSADIDSGRTSVGPHRDDWCLTLDGKPVRQFASRGEVRSAMFALHLSRFHVLTEKRGIEPVVLIDDVMSELDIERRKRVLELLPPGQIFMSACDPPPEIEALGIGELRHFVMENGSATQVG